MIKDFQFEEDIIFQYEPYQIISNMKLVVGLVSYNHDLDVEKEKLVNKESWEEVQQIFKRNIKHHQMKKVSWMLQW
jgi:hypothetical protein